MVEADGGLVHGLVAAPATPPILSALIRAHAAFILKKSREREPWTLEALCVEADGVDRRARFAQRYKEWLTSTATAVDWKHDANRDLT